MIGMERGVPTVLIGMIVVNAGLMFYGAARKSPQAQAPLRIERDAVRDGAPSLVAGLGAAGELVNRWPDGAPRLWAVRYVSSKCGYCASDERGKQLVQRLRQSDIPVLTLVPRAGEEIPEEAAHGEITFVPLEWIKRFRLTTTPTVLLFDGAGSLLWHHEGTLTDTHLRDALRIVAGAPRSVIVAR